MKSNPETLESALLRAYPASVPSDALRRRINQIPTRTRPRRVFRTVLAYGTCMAAIGAVAFLAPRAEAITTLGRIAATVQAARSWHMVTYAPDAASSLTQAAETWCRDGVVREDSERGRQHRLISPRATLEYREGEAEALRMPGRDASAQMMSLSNFVRQLQTAVYLSHVTVSKAEIDGRKATVVTAEANNEPVRIRLYADSESNFPFLGTVESQVGNGWQLIRKTMIDQDPFPASKVGLNLPPGIPTLDYVAARQKWAVRFSQGKTVLRAKGQGRVSLYDVEMNDRGDVFVLYSDGGADLLDVFDSRGNRFLNASAMMEGSIRYIDGRPLEGLVVDGRAVNARLYVPASPLPRSERADLKLTFGIDTYVVPKGFKPKGSTVSIREMVRAPDVRLNHSVSIAPLDRALPSWMPFLGVPLREANMIASEDEARAKDAIARGDGLKGEEYARAWIHDIEIAAAQSGQSYAMYGMYDTLAQALALQGKQAEARRYWQRALDQHPDANSEQAIRARLARTGTP